MPRCARSSATTSARRGRWSRPTTCASITPNPRRPRRPICALCSSSCRNGSATTFPWRPVRCPTTTRSRPAQWRFFGERYETAVRVVEICDPAPHVHDCFSKELCGGTHAPATGFVGRLPDHLGRQRRRRAAPHRGAHRGRSVGLDRRTTRRPLGHCLLRQGHSRHRRRSNRPVTVGGHRAEGVDYRRSRPGPAQPSRRNWPLPQSRSARSP